MYYQQQPSQQSQPRQERDELPSLAQVERRITELRATPEFRNFERREHGAVVEEVEALYKLRETVANLPPKVSSEELMSRIAKNNENLTAVRDNIMQVRSRIEFRDWENPRNADAKKAADILCDLAAKLEKEGKELSDLKKTMPAINPMKITGSVKYIDPAFRNGQESVPPPERGSMTGSIPGTRQSPLPARSSWAHQYGGRRFD
jgi:hypothetical protein